jgi:hypothetical protein
VGAEEKIVQKEKPDALEVGEATPLLQAPAVELPIPRGVAGPGLLADTVVKQWEEHQPLHRIERSYGREGYDVHRSTICGWHDMLSKLTGPLIAAMWKDAHTNSPYLGDVLPPPWRPWSEGASFCCSVDLTGGSPSRCRCGGLTCLGEWPRGCSGGRHAHSARPPLRDVRSPQFGASPGSEAGG